MCRPVSFLCKLLMCLLLWLSFAMTGWTADGLYEDHVIDRAPTISGMPPFTYTYIYKAFIISNIPQDQVMRRVCGDTLNKKGHCNYLPLAGIGTFGKRKRDLLPGDMGARKMLITVVDRSTLSPAERTALAALMPAIYPGTAISTDGSTVQVWVQNSGKSGKEYQVLLDLPEMRVLDTVMKELRAIPEDRLPEGSKESVSFIRRVSRTAILSNDAPSTDMLIKALPYSEVTCYDFSQIDLFSQTAGINNRFIVCNWNGPVEFSWEMARKTFPNQLLDEVAAMPDGSRIGMSRWQRYCHQAAARAYHTGNAGIWVIGAPTAAFLQQLTGQVVAENLKERPYELSLCDFSLLKTLAVGVYVLPEDPDRNHLVLQQQLEENTGNVLNGKIKLLSVQNWGEILQRVLNTDPEAVDPFTSQEGIRMVNQASKADAVLLLWVKEIKPQVSYKYPMVRTTERFPAFTDREPYRPHKPDPEDVIIFVGHKYPQRENDPQYRRDLKRYYDEELPEYNKKYREWKEKKDRWEYERERHHVNYQCQLTATPQVAMAGYLKMIDAVATQKVLWSCEVGSAQTGESHIVKSIPVEVIGEDTDPPAPREVDDYTNTYTWPDCTRSVGKEYIYALGANTLLQGLNDGMKKLVVTALWPNDLRPWNRPGYIGGDDAEAVIAPQTIDHLQALVVDGKVMVPLPQFAKWLGADCFTVDKKDLTVNVVKKPKNILVKDGEQTAVIDGEEVTMDAPCLIRDDTCYVSLVFFAETFDVPYTKNPKTKTYLVTHPDDPNRVLEVTYSGE